MSREEQRKKESEQESQDRKGPVSFGFLRDIAGQALNQGIDFVVGRHIEREYLASVSGELADKYVRGREIAARLSDSNNLSGLNGDERACVRAYLKIRALPSSLPFYDRDSLTRDIDRQLTARAAQKDDSIKRRPAGNAFGPTDSKEKTVGTLRRSQTPEKDNRKSVTDKDQKNNRGKLHGAKESSPKPEATASGPVGTDKRERTEALPASANEEPKVVSPMKDRPNVGKSNVSAKLLDGDIGRGPGGEFAPGNKQYQKYIPESANHAVPPILSGLVQGSGRSPACRDGQSGAGPPASVSDVAKFKSESPKQNERGHNQQVRSNQLETHAKDALLNRTSEQLAKPDIAVRSSDSIFHEGSDAPRSSLSGAIKELAVGDTKSEPAQAKLAAHPGALENTIESAKIRESDYVIDKGHKRLITKRMVIDTFRRIAGPSRPGLTEQTLRVTARVGAVAAGASQIGRIIQMRNHGAEIPVARSFIQGRGSTIRILPPMAPRRLESSPQNNPEPGNLQNNRRSEAGQNVKIGSVEAGRLPPHVKAAPTRLSESEKRYLINGPELAFAAIIALAGAARPRTQEGAVIREERLIKNDISSAEPKNRQKKGELSEKKTSPDSQGKLELLSGSKIAASAGAVQSCRPRVLIGAGDSLVGLAEELFDDSQLAWLILEINENLPVVLLDGKHVVRLRLRQTLQIPTAGDINTFVRPDEPAANIITVVEGDVDKDLLAEVFEPFVGKSDVSELMNHFGDLTLLEQDED